MTAEPVNREALALKPCPFCNSAPTLRKTVEHYDADAKFPAGEFDVEHSITCDSCGASQTAEYRDDVIAAWNSRPDAERAEGEALAWAGAETMAALKAGHASYVYPQSDAANLIALYAAPPPSTPSSTGGEAGDWPPEAGTPWRGDLAEALTMTGCSDLADLIDMANVGNGLLERIDELVKDGPFKGWCPADDPCEIVFDLVNALEEALSRPQPVAETVEALTIEDRESLEFLRIGMSRFEGRNGNIRIDTATELPLILKGLAALAALRPSAHGEAG